MNLQITQTTSRLIASPANAQFIAPDGRAWRMLAGQTAGAWVAVGTVEQAATLSADVTLDAKTCLYTVTVPDGMIANGNPRFVRLHLYAEAVLDSVAFACTVDLTTGEMFDTFFSAPEDRGARLGETLVNLKD